MTSIPSRLGRIVAGDYVYQITPDDVLWLARAVHKEGGSNAATVWTYFQRQAANRRSSSLASLVLAHSQPVNPAWRADGEKCRPGGPYHGTERCTPSQLASRAANAVRPWGEIPASVRDVVVAGVTGRLPNPVPGATDFADEEVSMGFLRRNPGARMIFKAPQSACPRCNWYIDEGSLRAPVFVDLDGQRAGAAVAAAGIGFGTLVVALVAGYAAYRWSR